MKLADDLQLQRMASVYEQQLELCERHQQETELSTLHIRDAKHNMKNNLISILAYAENGECDKIPSLTVAEIKNRCIPCVYWGTAIFVVVMKYSNLFFSFAFFLDRSHFAFGYELIISSEAAGFMKIICNGFTLI